MASGMFPGQDPSRQEGIALWETYSALPTNALAEKVQAALGYFAYASSDPQGMDELSRMLETNTPSLGRFRAVFTGEFLVRQIGNKSLIENPDTETIIDIVEEFDLTMLALYFSELRKPLQSLSTSDFIARKLHHGVAVANRSKPEKEIEELRKRHPRLYELSAALAQSALDRVRGMDAALPSEAASRNGYDDFNGLSDERKELFMRKRFAQHVAIFTVAAALNQIEKPVAI